MTEGQDRCIMRKADERPQKTEVFMVALKIEDIKTCTAKLFLGGEFDSFLVREASIVTFNRFTIDGHVEYTCPPGLLHRRRDGGRRD